MTDMGSVWFHISEIMSKISWPIWIHAHKNVIACQLFSHVMGNFHGGNRDIAGVFMDASAWRL